MLGDDARGTRWLEDILEDARYAFRGMARSKAFFTPILFVLAVGIGVNTTMLSAVPISPHSRNPKIRRLM